MAALTAARNTPTRDGKDFAYGMATGVTIFQGALVALTAAGYATPGATATTLKAAGRAKTTVANPGANGAVSHGVIIDLGDRRYRLKNLEEGEVALYDDQGQTIILKRDGIRIETSLKVDVIAPDVTVEADTVTVTADTVNLGGTGGAAVARVGDSVSGGVITSGSSKVKAA